jgi:hypothetical protein
MQKWEYHSLIIRDLAIADAKMNAEGEKGWELVSICLVDEKTARCYFKRPVEEGRVETTLSEREVVAIDHNPFEEMQPISVKSHAGAHDLQNPNS